MKRLLITGGTGFIGTALVKQLLLDQETQLIILTRHPDRHRQRLPARVRLVESLDQLEDDTVLDAIINLAGEGIADRRWSEARKQVLLQSRLQVTEALVKLVERLQQRPSVMISASAIGFYGSRDATPITEDDPGMREFTHDLCRRWEQAAAPVEALGVRLCIARLGVVLGREGGMVSKLKLPFQMAMGGPIGSGRQVISWIHLDDLIRALQFLLDNEGLDGVFNFTAPQPVTNRQFSKAFGRVLRRPAILPMPAISVRLMFGEMGMRLLLSGQYVLPQRLQDAGFQWRYCSIDEALLACL